uniref:Coiled-coil domain containing 136b n=1 Tax=Cynoglossus semilaevis TaxID=244447 RepID=A0A3P8URF1_CYNSE
EKCQQQDEEKEVKEEKVKKTNEGQDEEEDGEREAWEEEQEVEELRAQVMHLLMELEETREVSQRHEDSFTEMQGQSVGERLASTNQAETFTRQIHRLQGTQLRSVQEEMHSVEEEKDRELDEMQEELRLAHEEVLLLQQAAEEVAAERENDIALLQEELCRMRAELQRLHATAQEYELEITTLRAEINCPPVFGLKNELAELQQRYDLSQRERAALEQQLQHCRTELQKLGSKTQVPLCMLQVRSVSPGGLSVFQLLVSPTCHLQSEPPVLSAPLIGLVVIVALIWCWWEELAS